MAEGKYLYCIIKREDEQKFEIKGIEGKDVYAISEDKFSAVVSDSEIKEYFISRENLLAHQKVIEAISKHRDVLPVSFGTIAENAEDLKQRILKQKSKELQVLLEKIHGKVELGLKALWPDMRLIFEEIAKTTPSIQQLRKVKNIDYKQKISVGELVGKILEERRETEKEKILTPLKKIADDLKENKIFGDDMICNVAFLVRKNKEKEFDRSVETLGRKYGQRIKFMYVGPLPPYNFVVSEFQ